MEGRRRNTSNNYNYDKNNNNNNNNNNYRERCLTMHQPWASLLVHGIKRIEGRSWPSPLTGRLWIHAASKVPEDAIIKTMEDFYREIYARDGITDLEFPQNYPVSRLVGCVEVVGYLRRGELACWKEVPEGVRLEALTDFCWLCEHPQKLPVPLEMGGWRGVYDLDGKISEAAIGSLVRAESPLSLKFPLPNPQDPSSLRPGSISPRLLEPEVELSPKLKAAIDAASQAATQFSNKGQSSKGNSFDSRSKGNFTRPEDSRFIRNNQYTKDYHFDSRNRRYFTRPAAAQYVKKEQNMGKNVDNSRNSTEDLSTQFVQKNQTSEINSLGNSLSTQCRIEKEENCNDYRSTPKIFAAAMRGVRPAPRTS